MLLVHGEADDVVPVQRSRDAEAALRAANVPVEAVYVPRLGHGIDDTGLAMGALAAACWRAKPDDLERIARKVPVAPVERGDIIPADLAERLSRLK